MEHGRLVRRPGSGFAVR